MKYSNIIKTAIPAVALALVACSSDEDGVNVGNKTNPVSGEITTFTATIESDEVTRATISGSGSVWNTTWDETDKINVFNSKGTSAPFKITKIENNVATFTKDDNTSLGDTGPFYAAYSHSTKVLTPSEGGVLTGTIPTIYTGSGDNANIRDITVSDKGFNTTYRYLVACADNQDKLEFKNVLSFIRIKAQASTEFPFRTIKIIANNQEKIAGDFSVKVGDANSNPTCTAGDDASSFIKIAVADNDDHEYFIPVIPQTLAKGFTLLFETEGTDAQRIYQRIMNTSFKFDRTKVHDLGEYSYNGNGTKMTGQILDNVVDLDLPSGTLWYTVNAFDAAATKEHSKDKSKTATISRTDPASSFYAWGELLTKSNQYYEITNGWLIKRYSLQKKDNACLNYSWYYTYGITQGTDDEEEQDNSAMTRKRSYKFGCGSGNLADLAYPERRYYFISQALTGRSTGVLMRYNNYSSYGSSITDWGGGVDDGKTILASDDDIVYQNSAGHRMCMPTSAQFGELCNLTIEKVSGSNVFKLTSSNGRFITLPFGGYKHTQGSSSTASAQSDRDTDAACYWTRELAEGNENSYMAKSFVISTNNTASIVEAERCQGRMVRGVVLNSAIAPSQSYR